MKKIVKKYILKGAGVLLIFIVLLLSNLPVMANTMDISTQTNIIDKSSYIPSPMFDGSWEIIFDENFTDGVPPTGDWGDWDLNQTNQDETWHRDASDPHSEPYCATVCRNESLDLQDEWLITSEIELVEYDEYLLDFWAHSARQSWDNFVRVWIGEPDFFDDVYGLDPPDPIEDADNLIWKINGKEWPPDDQQWRLVTLDLAEFADQTVKIAFQYGKNDGSDPSFPFWL